MILQRWLSQDHAVRHLRDCLHLHLHAGADGGGQVSCRHVYPQCILQTVDSSQVHGYSFVSPPGWHYRVTETMTINRYSYSQTKNIFMGKESLKRRSFFSSEQSINVCSCVMYLLNHNQNRLDWNDERRKLLLIFVEIIKRGTCIVWMWQTGNFNNQLRHKIIDSSWLIISTGSWRWWCRWARCPTAPSPTPRLPSCWPGWRPSSACSPPGGRTTSTHTKHVSSNQQDSIFHFML